MRTSDKGLRFIAQHEGWRPSMYRDPVGYPTIGYGHLIQPGEEHLHTVTLTKEEGLELLAQDVAIAERGVRQAVTVPLTQAQFDALVSFTFNVGVGKFEGSTLRRKLAARDYAGAAREFPRWVYARGQKLPGLVRRRHEEMQLFAGELVGKSKVVFLLGFATIAPFIARLLLTR